MVSLTPRFVRRTALAVGITALALVGSSIPAGAAAPGTETGIIDSYSAWNGTDYLYPFGNPDTSTYGQVVTIPAGNTKIRWIKFWMAAADGTLDGSMTFRGEVYGWDGTKATTPVAESNPKTLSVTAGDPFAPVKLKVRGKVTAGQQYVLFASISKDYEASDPGVLTKWGCNYTDVLPGGQTVYLNDAGDESQWTTQPWSQIGSFDMAMKAKVK